MKKEIVSWLYMRNYSLISRGSIFHLVVRKRKQKSASVLLVSSFAKRHAQDAWPFFVLKDSFVTASGKGGGGGYVCICRCVNSVGKKTTTCNCRRVMYIPKSQQQFKRTRPSSFSQMQTQVLLGRTPSGLNSLTNNHLCKSFFFFGPGD